MGLREHFVSVRPYFWHAVAATSAVILLPLVVVFGALALLDPDPPVIVAAFFGVGLAIAAMAIGAALWMRKPQSVDIGFSELMLWRWNRRRRAEESLSHGARLLGLDRSGQPVDEVRITPEQQLRVLKDLTAALESKDPYTHGHSQRVERHSYRTAAAMGLSAGDIEDLRKAAALHDVGKIRVPDRILRKAGPLTEDERVIVEEHAMVGAWMVSSVGNADVIAAVRHHHEKWDGSGYPDGLAGSQVPLFARVIAVADAYDAITSTRPYRASSGRDEAVDALRAESGTQFDPEVVEAFIAALPSRVPVAAGVFLLLGGPTRLFREIAVWLRRLGAGSLTPAAGATGAAIVLGASIFTPSLVDDAPALQKRAAAVTTVNNAPPPGEVDDEANARKPKKQGEKKERKREGRRAPARVASSGDGAKNGGNNGANGTTVAGTVITNDAGGNGSGSNNEPKGPPAPPPPPEPSPPAEANENPNDGRDVCNNDGDAGQGNDKDGCDD